MALDAWNEMRFPTVPTEPITVKIAKRSGYPPYLMINGFRYAPARKYDSAWLLGRFATIAKQLRDSGVGAKIEVFAIELTMLAGLFENGVVTRTDLAAGVQDEYGIWMSVNVRGLELPLLVRPYANLYYNEFWLVEEGVEGYTTFRPPDHNRRVAA